MRFRLDMVLLLGIFLLLIYSIYEIYERDFSFFKSTFRLSDQKFLLTDIDLTTSWQYCDKFNAKAGQSPVCGKPFNSSWEPYLHGFNLTDSDIAKVTPEDDARILKKNPVFITAFSDNHFESAMHGVLKSYSELSNDTMVIVYDLGLSTENIKKLNDLSFVNSIRKLNFTDYPSYVGKLFEYRWKVFLLAEVLQEFESIFYCDSHFFWTADDVKKIIDEQINCQQPQCNYYSHVMVGETQHSIFATTDNRSYEYIPMDITMAKNVMMGNAGTQFISYTKDVRSNIFKWAVLCALEEDCMAPKGAHLACNFNPATRWTVYGNCHRYDQSIFSVLLANRNNYKWSNFVPPFSIVRN